jgi:hypothetical protein
MPGIGMESACVLAMMLTAPVPGWCEDLCLPRGDGVGTTTHLKLRVPVPSLAKQERERCRALIRSGLQLWQNLN